MRCRSCDCALSDKESTNRSDITEEYFDLCTKCFETIKDDLEVEIIQIQEDEPL